MIFRIPPSNFKKRFDIVGTFVQFNGKFILLLRHPDDDAGNQWGLPAGKQEKREDLKVAALRELWEETAIKPDHIKHFDSVYVRNGDLDIGWHMFSTKLDSIPEIKINPREHSAYKWVSAKEALTMPLIHDLAESVEMFYQGNKHKYWFTRKRA